MSRAVHGTESRYVLGCRCDACQAARLVAERGRIRRRRARGWRPVSHYTPQNPRPVRWCCETCGQWNDRRTWALPAAQQIRCAHPWRDDRIRARQAAECAALMAEAGRPVHEEGATA